MDLLNKQRVVIEEQVKEQAEYNLLGRVNLTIDGGTVFEYNHETKEMKRAVFQESEEIALGQTARKKIHTEKGCTYIEALNEKNAWKRLRKGKTLFTSN